MSSEKNAQGDDIVKKSEKNERKNCEDKFLRMSLRVSCGIVMDLIMGGILVLREQLLKFYKMASIGLLSLKMLVVLLRNVTDVKG